MMVPGSITEVQQAVHSVQHLRVAGGATKSALSCDATLSTRKLSGVLEYEPSEYTFTALAGTPLQDIVNTLVEHNQFLPFDPPLVESGATLGGTVAAGLSGPGRLRYGGLRDFLLGTRVVTGGGRIVFGGGKVVKNAAGFDIPKLMVGGLGTMAILVELTFKVFPRPERYVSLSVDLEFLQQALDFQSDLMISPLELACLDFVPPGTLWMRIGGMATAIEKRVDRLCQFVGESARIYRDQEDEELWRSAREFHWVPPEHDLVKMPILPQQIQVSESYLTRLDCEFPRRYSMGGNLLWLAWPREQQRGLLDEFCIQLQRPALAVTGNWPVPWLGPRQDNLYRQRLSSVFDPESKLARVPTGVGQ